MLDNTEMTPSATRDDAIRRFNYLEQMRLSFASLQFAASELVTKARQNPTVSFVDGAAKSHAQQIYEEATAVIGAVVAEQAFRSREMVTLRSAVKRPLASGFDELLSDIRRMQRGGPPPRGLTDYMRRDFDIAPGDPKTPFREPGGKTADFYAMDDVAKSVLRNIEDAPPVGFNESMDEEPHRCHETKVIEDPVSVMHYRCELPENHEGDHRTTYCGVEGDITAPITWTRDDGGRIVYTRGDSRKDEDLRSNV